MNCPLCGCDNLEGADACSRCGADLRDGEALAATSDLERELLHCSLGDLAADGYIEVSPECSVAETVRRWHQQGCHCAIVVESGRIVGIFTERDLLMKLAHRFAEAADAPVRDYMTPDPVTLNCDDPAAFALNRMMVGGYRHIPIQRDGALAGMVSVRDILAYLARQFEDVIAADVPA